MAASGHSDEDLKNPNLFPLLRSGKWASWGQPDPRAAGVG